MANNLSVYLRELPDIGLIAGQIFGNIGNALSAPFEAGENKQGRLDGLAGTLLGVLDNFNQNVNAVPYVDVPIVGTVSQRDVGALLPVLAGAAYASLEPIINFATTPISGLLVGAIGPVVAPVLAVVNSISNAFALLQESNFGGALVELINIPANTIGAFLNGGQTLDLTPLLNLVGVTLPDEIKSLGLRMGGLLSPGGVAFDALAAEAEASGLAVDVPGLPVGPIGALAGLANYVSRSMVVTPPTEAQTPAETAAAVTAPEASAPAESTPAPQPIAAREADEATAAAADAADAAADPATDATAVAAAAEAPKAAADKVSADPAPAPKRGSRGAAARGASDDAKPAARAAASRRAG